MNRQSLKYSSDEARQRFKKVADNEKAAVHKIQQYLIKPLTIYADFENNSLNVSDTKLIVEKDGVVSGLFIGWNQLGELPSEIGTLSDLKIFYGQTNHLTQLPDFWDRLHMLTRIGLCNNELQELPTTMGKLKHLSYIDLSNNRFQQIPSQIKEWNQTEVELDYNPIGHFGPEILETTCICYFTRDSPRLAIGYHGDVHFQDESARIWNDAIDKYSGYRVNAEKVWDYIKEQIKKNSI